MKSKKLYTYNTAIGFGIMLSVILIGLIIPVILYPKETWFLVFGIFLVLLIIWYMIGTGFFFPIYINDAGLKYRGKRFSWSDIKITAYNRKYRVCYLVFGENYLYGSELKKAIRRGFWIYLKEKPLKELLCLYQKQILILDVDGQKEDNCVCSSQKIKDIIKNHNSKFHK